LKTFIRRSSLIEGTFQTSGVKFFKIRSSCPSVIGGGEGVSISQIIDKTLCKGRNIFFI
jgi:hypothetical protein